MKNKNFDDWKKKFSEETKQSETNFVKKSLEGLDIRPLYTNKDIAEQEESMPGFFPYKRGIRASMYTHKPWTIRQYAGFSTAKETNLFYKDCLKHGQRGLSVAFDLPTHRGYDSDNPLVISDVGKAGVAIDSVEDMQELFEGIDLSKVSVSMTMNGAVLPILASFLVTAFEKGVSKEQISGTIQNDILKEFMVRNTYIYPPKPSMRIVTDVMEYCTKNLPSFNSISVSGYHIHEAGADLALELALTICDGIEYVKSAQKRGLAIDDFAPRISFFFATGMNFFMEIAKLRAARKIWAEKMLELGALDEKSMLLRTHCQTSGWSLAAMDPYNNIIRTTLEALSSVLGGTQSLHTNSFDEALALPTPFSARIARNTQLILQHETGITDVVDPLAGSYYLENLTCSIENKAKEIIHEIEKLGGMTESIEKGIPMMWIERSALKRQAMLDSKQEIKVGVNSFIAEDEKEFETLYIDNHQVIKEQKIKLQNLKKNRNENEVKKSLEQLQKAASGNENLLELSINAIKNRATIGEISFALEKVFGRFKPSLSTATGVYRSVYKDEKGLKEVIDEVNSIASQIGRQPRILVAKIGQDGHDRGAKVIASAFSDLGFDVDISSLFETPALIAKQALENDVHVIGISTLAAGHNTFVPELMAELKKLKSDNILVVLGGVIPPCDYNNLLKQGVVHIFSPGTSVVDAAKVVLKKIKEQYYR